MSTPALRPTDDQSRPADHVFLRSDAIDRGMTDKQLAAGRRSGDLHRIRRGAYCPGPLWRECDDDTRHLMHAQAVLLETTGDVALSHVTAALAHGMDVWGAPLEQIHVTRADTAAGRHERDVRHHVGKLEPAEIVKAAGFPVTPPARAVVECIATLGSEPGLVIADSSIRKGLCTKDEIVAMAAKMSHWPGSLPVHVVTHHVDGRHESVAETRGAHLFWHAGLPTPIPQFDILDRGRLVATVDFAWPEHKLIVEIDGRVKYEKYLRPGESPGDAVWREKKREDKIRRLTGWTVIRLTWADLENPAATARLIREAMGLL